MLLACLKHMLFHKAATCPYVIYKTQGIRSKVLARQQGPPKMLLLLQLQGCHKLLLHKLGYVHVEDLLAAFCI